MSLANLVNHQIRLAARPVGMPKATDWSHTTEPVRNPQMAASCSRRWPCPWTPPCAAG
jgi:hypothetical protein